MGELITASRKATFNACVRLHHYKYELGFRPLAGGGEAIDFGSAFHLALEAWWKAYQRGEAESALGLALEALDGAPLDEAAAAKARVLMRGYDVRWAGDMGDLEVIAVELEFRAPLLTYKGKHCREVIAGKIDGVVRRRSTGEYWLVEHKTSAADLSPGSSYWQRLRMDSQVSMYFDGALAHGYRVAGCIYDVIAKPDHRPYKATPVESRKYKADGSLYANQRVADETMEAYTARLTDVVGSQPDEHFLRAEVVRLDTELEASRRDLYETALLMRRARSGGLAPRSPGNCHAYGRPCGFLDVCSGAASLDDETRFQKLAHVHQELKND